MNIQQLREQLEIDEGVKYDIYLDHLGLPTFGIGHLVTKTDPESGQAVGTPISKERVAECFDMDVQSVINDCNKLYEDFEESNLVEEYDDPFDQYEVGFWDIYNDLEVKSFRPEMFQYILDNKKAFTMKG